ncbi:hypothetical protein NE237_003762 [Protea cynaroides]|uniref:RING-type E3 ubiquitin transferase n=1 Tax=Protea cynaroides TaxID=273540 RepID=A0A9Q0QSW7_9MAGN|nr:hypothetical protein NE237_003762 [Protea cynaroides]
MPPSVNIQSLRTFCSFERLTNSDIFGPKVSIHFKVQHQQLLVTTTLGGSETIRIGVRSPFMWPGHVFNMEFSNLLIPLVLENYIHDMLKQVEIPPSTIEGLIRHISTYAFHMASIYQQRKSRCFDIFVGLNVQLVETVEEENTEELEESMLTVIDGDDGGFSLVPASRNSIQALETKEFDDNIEEEETCMICMDEFVRGIHVTKLPCSHFFHSECILTWLKNKNSCPSCRFAMPTERGLII